MTVSARGSRPSAQYQRFHEWLSKRTPAERALQALAFRYERRYFADMRLATASAYKALFMYEAALDGYVPEPADAYSPSIRDWIFKYRCSVEFAGLCDSKHRTIYIDPDLDEFERRATVLHEMIHAYEADLSPPFRDWLLLRMHKQMLKRLRRSPWRRYMDASLHAHVHGEQHGLLFLWKSLDLDLRLGWMPGSVFGYGRGEYFGWPRELLPPPSITICH